VTLSVLVLGPVEAYRDGHRLPVPAGLPAELLVRLALEAGRAVSVDRLIDDLWLGSRASTSRNTLQSKVSQLRRALGDGSPVISVSDGYALAVGSVDTELVVRRAAELRALRAAADAVRVVEACTAALELFRGELLPGSAAPWLAPHRARFADLRAEFIEERLAARLDLGESHALLSELRAAVEDAPLQERRWVLLITALYRAGRQAEALAAYAEVRALLDDELGLLPGPELRALEERVLQQDPELVPVTEGRRSAPGIVVGAPYSIDTLVGRAADVAAVLALLATERLVTVTGPAGVGKTRLAIEVARQSVPAGGAWLVRLENAGEPAAVVRVVSETVGVPEFQLVGRLQGPEVLLILDNCEHLWDDVAGLAETLLAEAPRLRILATSQMSLDVPGERCYPLEPLSTVDAVTLFTKRAIERSPGFAVDERTAPLLTELCRDLDGLPLAIELAAARTRALPVPEIVRRLTDRFALLGDPSGRSPERHRTLRAALAWSYDLLFPDDQRGLWALSCFADGAPLPAAEKVMTALGIPSAAVLDIITRLADRSLVRVEHGRDGAVRYRLLDSVRAFALARSEEAGSDEVIRRAHAEWFAAAAADARVGSRTADQTRHVALAVAERANIDAALEWARAADPALGVTIATGFAWVWVVLGDGAAGARRIRHALGAASLGSDRDHAYGLLVASWLEASAGSIDQAFADLERAVSLAADMPDLPALSHWYRAFVLISQGRPRDALDALEQCRAAIEAAADPWQLGGYCLLAAFAELGVGEVTAAADACRRAVSLIEPLGDAWARAHAEAMLGNVARAVHQFDASGTHFAHAARAAASLGFAGAEAHHLSNLGRVRQMGGDLDGALDVLATAITKAQAAGDLRLVAVSEVRRARVLRALGRTADAMEALDRAGRWFADFGGGEGALLGECVRASIRAVAGDAGAVDALRRTLSAAREVGDAEVEVLALDALARAAADPVAGQEFLAAADAAYLRAAHLMVDDDRLDARVARGR
jgi:predicted ATPase/DNA-binding SARP family transcriptional activator